MMEPKQKDIRVLAVLRDGRRRSGLLTAEAWERDHPEWAVVGTWLDPDPDYVRLTIARRVR
jgi:hypothetical protein